MRDVRGIDQPRSSRPSSRAPGQPHFARRASAGHRSRPTEAALAQERRRRAARRRDRSVATGGLHSYGQGMVGRNASSPFSLDDVYLVARRLGLEGVLFLEKCAENRHVTVLLEIDTCRMLLYDPWLGIKVRSFNETHLACTASRWAGCVTIRTPLAGRRIDGSRRRLGTLRGTGTAAVGLSPSAPRAG